MQYLSPTAKISQWSTSAGGPKGSTTAEEPESFPLFLCEGTAELFFCSPTVNLEAVSTIV